MPVIAPFQGLRYDPKRIKSLSAVVTPPYDIISPRQQTQLYRRHPTNFIRVVYGKKRSGDTKTHNVYSRARADWDRWIRQGILKQDETPAVYPYEQSYRLGGKLHRRTGVIALVSLDSRVYPHEHTFGGPKKDRLELMKAVNASLDPIFGLVPDAGSRYQRFVDRICRGRRPVASFTYDGVRHRLWRITDPAWIRQLQRMLRAKELVIADGHHRFEAAKIYRDQQKPRKDAPYNFVMFYLSAAGTEEPGLLPTHRLVSVRPPARLKQLLEQLKARKQAEPVASRERLVGRLQALQSKRKLGVGLYSGNGAGYLLQPPRGSSFQLDVEWLHQSLLEKELEPVEKIRYTQDLPEAYEQVRAGRAQAVFVMQRPRLQDVFARARSGRRMPKKTTYFYPKLLSGLIGYSFGG